eukprot:GILI01007472.1.p1 GENE.GILI01007472.1~~GILI01007472.1.p1  ORF type:complete len:318 (-),score=42.67 GILI01007472.1:199-1152(-)
MASDIPSFDVERQPGRARSLTYSFRMKRFFSAFVDVPKKELTSEEEESLSRYLQPVVRIMDYSSRVLEICVTLLLLYLIIELAFIKTPCSKDSLPECINRYVEAGGDYSSLPDLAFNECDSLLYGCSVGSYWKMRQQKLQNQTSLDANAKKFYSSAALTTYTPYFALCDCLIWAGKGDSKASYATESTFKTNCELSTSILAFFLLGIVAYAIFCIWSTLNEEELRYVLTKSVRTRALFVLKRLSGFGLILIHFVVCSEYYNSTWHGCNTTEMMNKGVVIKTIVNSSLACLGGMILWEWMGIYAVLRSLQKLTSDLYK